MPLQRHYFASSSLRNGATLANVSKCLGHSNISTTSAYIHQAPNEICSNFIDLSTDTVTEEELTVTHTFVEPVKKERKKKSVKKVNQDV